MGKKSDAKKTNRSGKKAKGTLSARAVVSMKSSNPAAKPNPFETIWSRRKFDVLGKSRKGDERRIGQARAIAIEKRTKTLLKEYEQSAKSVIFSDNRIGEKDDTLQVFDKAVLRLQQIKMKKTKKYDLSDEEEDYSKIYDDHSLERDDFDDEVPLDDDNDAENDKEAYFDSKESNHLSLHHSLIHGSLEEDGKTHKSKKQVMSEIIAKSKMYKAERAANREEDDHLMEKLDENFTHLAQSEALQSLTRPNKINALKALLNKNDTKKPSLKGPSHLSDKDAYRKEEPDAYDKLVKDLILDRRAYASDRTKTPEEIAQEEKERLEELEKHRRERMLATDDSSDDGSDSGEDIEKPASKKLRSLSDDDPTDTYCTDTKSRNKDDGPDDEQNGMENHDERNSDSQDSEDEEDDEGDDMDETNSSLIEYGSNSTIKDWEKSDDEDMPAEGEEAENSYGNNISNNDKSNMGLSEIDSTSNRKNNASVDQVQSKIESLPYVIEAPRNLADLCNLLDKCSENDVVEAINRIRVCNTIRLSVENRKKMQVFYGVLLQYFAVLATRSPLKVRLMNSLVKPLIEMSAETPYFAAICARQRLIHIRSRFCEDLKISGKSCWPTLKTLVLLRLWTLIFPCSDFRHVVTTPSLLLMCEYLMRCHISSGRDIALGSFLCCMVLTVIKQSRKICPEAILYLENLLVSATSLKLRPEQHFQFNLSMELGTLRSWLVIKDRDCDVHPMDFYKIMDMQEDSPFFASDNFKASVLVSIAEILKGFICIYEGLSSFAEVFLPISFLLKNILQEDNLPDQIRSQMQEAFDMINKKTAEHNTMRQPLQMRKQKPVPIKQLNPKFEENFVKGRDYDPDRERAEMKKLKKRLKNEKKGAIRELRKDSRFISKLKESERLIKEGERTEEYGKAFAFLQEQEHAFKSGQLGKGKGKKTRK